MPKPPSGPALAPAQLLPTFARAAQLTGVPQEVLLAIARIESGFDPGAVGPYLPQFAGTEDQHALGMMQFLPSSYRPHIGRVDAATGKGLGLGGIWDAESSIYAAAYYLQDNGAPGDLRRAIFAYNHADWYVDLILAWAAYYAGGTIPDPNMFRDNGQARVVAAPENPLLPVQNGRHLDLLSPLPLYAPFTAGQVWRIGGDGSFYGRDLHTDAGGAHYAIDFNKGPKERPEPSEGQPVLAAADGIINNVYATFGGGWTVEMYHRSPQGTLLRSVYVHLKDDPRVSAKIRVNQTVPHGTTIGYVGNTGYTSTGAHLHFALYVLQDKAWVSIRPEPMEGQLLQDGGTIVSRNDLAGSETFERVWNITDQPLAAGHGQDRSWLWGPQSLTSTLIEGYASGGDTQRLVQYYDKGRMERRDDGKGGFFVTVGKLGWELLTGKVDLGNGRAADYKPAQVPLVGHMNNQAVPTYADAAVEAANRTLDHGGVPVTWKLTRGGKIVPFTPPAMVSLTNYDPVTGHNVADVFAQWYDRTFFASHRAGPPGYDVDGLPTLSLLTREQTGGLEPGHPLTDPFWVEVLIDGMPRMILVQIFERWTLTFSPDNPEGWQIELGNVGRHYYDWRYETDAREALGNDPAQTRQRRRTWGKGRTGDGGRGTADRLPT